MTTMIAPLYTCRAYKRERLRPIPGLSHNVGLITLRHDYYCQHETESQARLHSMRLRRDPANRFCTIRCEAVWVGIEFDIQGENP